MEWAQKVGFFAMRTIWTPPFVMIMISYWWCTIHFKLLVLSWPFMYSTNQCGVSWPEATRFHEMFYLLKSNSILCVLVKWNATIVCYEDCSCIFLQIAKLTLFWCKKKKWVPFLCPWPHRLSIQSQSIGCKSLHRMFWNLYWLQMQNKMWHFYVFVTDGGHIKAKAWLKQ